MKFCSTKISGVWIVDVDKKEDERGFFARTWCKKEFQEKGLETKLVQASVSWNHHKHTLRGMHYQSGENAETKLVRCIRGAIYDVVLDLRPDSETYKNWVSFALDQDNRTAVYIPKGCAHGFLTLEDNTELFYQMSEFYVPDAAKGVRWNDPSFGIDWPFEPKSMNEKDKLLPDYEG